MSLVVTLPATYDGTVLRRAVIAAYPSLLNGQIIYNIEGNQLTIEGLSEVNRTTVEGIVEEQSKRQVERDAVIAAFKDNVAFINLGNPGSQQVIAQVKALSRQMNYVAKTLFDAGLL